MATAGMYDIANRMPDKVAQAKQATQSTNKKAGTELDMTDFLQLMVAMFQNQDIDNAASTTDMMNQMVQMSVVQAITNITDATVMMYAGSLVGKEVTVGTWNGGELQETVGTVTGTGMAGGQQVIFVNGKSYYLSDIMAVGRLPDVEAPGETPEDPEVDPTEPPEGSDNDHSTDNSGENPNIPEE